MTLYQAVPCIHEQHGLTVIASHEFIRRSQLCSGDASSYIPLPNQYGNCLAKVETSGLSTTLLLCNHASLVWLFTSRDVRGADARVMPLVLQAAER